MMRAEQLDRAEAEAADAERQAEIAAAQAAAEAVEVAELFYSGEPPDDVEADTEGLPPQRARLVRFAAWLGHLEQQLADLERGREAYLESMGAPTLTQSKLDALISA